MLFPAINLLPFYISKLSYYNQLSAQRQYLMLQLKHYISNMFPISSFIIRETYICSTKHEVQQIFKIVMVLYSEADSLKSVQKCKMWTADNPV